MLKMLDNKNSNNKRSMLSQISLVAGGTVIAQALNMLCTPILSRIYSPEDFGIMSVFASVMSILAPLSSMRYYLSIALPKTKRYSDACVWLSFAIEIITTVMFFIVALLLGNKLLTMCEISKLIPYKFLLPVGIFFYATYMLLTQWAIRNAIFGVIARTKISQSVSGNAVKVGMGLLGIKPMGLIVGTIISYGGGITTILREMIKNDFPKSCSIDMKRVALKYRNFPKYDVLSSILDVVSIQLIPVVIFAYFGAKVTGFYSMATQLLVIPSVFVGDAIRQVFLQRASKAKYEGGIEKLSMNIYGLLLEVALFPMLVLALFAPQLLEIFLGASWYETGAYVQVILMVTLITFAYSPVSCLFAIMNKQALFLKLMLLHLFIKFAAFFLAIYFKQKPVVAIGIMCFASCIAMIVVSYFTLNLVGVDVRKYIGILVRSIIMTTLMISPIFLAHKYIANLCCDIVIVVLMSILYIYCIVRKYNFGGRNNGG